MAYPTGDGCGGARVGTRLFAGGIRHAKVYIARAAEIPSVLTEIGRLREITFRAAGEGTGKALDLDRYDSHYLHLFVWNEHAKEVVGAYRLASGGQGAARVWRRGALHGQPVPIRR